ncbi:MAG: type VII secretion-associated serine protease mycosin [Mycolicibacterium sp.]|uniref:type VII secretion-associated serine protease mycosin n=1 Tax=Mycolicibacterium sp. TaxID=2320850 RepID=UPI003D147B5A
MRLLTAPALAVAPLWVTPTAAAVTPPRPDEARLPAAGPAAPPRPTSQHGECVTAPVMPPEPGEPGQLVGVDLSTVWALTRGAGQTVAVIDTGVARHQLLPHLLPGGDYVSSQDGTADCDGHGTIVAGIIGAAPDSTDTNGPEAFSGIAPDVSILAIRQSSNKFREVGAAVDSGVGDVDTLAAAVRAAADLGATVINISSVACLSAEAEIDDRALGAALAYAVDVKNVVVVSAAGNVGGAGQCPGHNPSDSTGWEDVAVVASPAWYDEYVLTVGSVRPDGTASTFSLAGPWVDVAAPGEGVVSLAPAAEGLVNSRNGEAAISGTSYSAAVVSAIAALVRARTPGLTARQVMQRVEETSLHPAGGWNASVGRGVVDALAALSELDGSAPGRPWTPNVETAGTEPAAGGRPERTAARGAAICLALTGGIVLVSKVAGRLRRREVAVSGD